MGIERYYTTAGSNTDVDGINIAEGMAPSLVNNAMRQMVANVRKWFNDAEWVQFGSGDGPPDISYASATSFTVNGVDVTDEYHAGRRVKAVGSSTGTIYGTIQSSDFVTNTTVTVDWDSGQLENEALEIYLAILRANNPSQPNSAPGLQAIKGASAAILSLEDTGAGTNAKILQIVSDGGNLIIRSLNDNGSLKATPVTIGSSGEITVEGSTMTLGTQGDGYLISRGNANGTLYLAGGTGHNDGGNILLRDGTAGNDVRIRQDGNPRMIVAEGVQVGFPSGGDPGAGKINAQGYQVNGTDVFPVGQAGLKTTTAAQSDDQTVPPNSQLHGLFTLTGGQYILGIEYRKHVGNPLQLVYGYSSQGNGNGTTSGTFATLFPYTLHNTDNSQRSCGIEVRHRYVQASPPYDLGDGAVQGFVYVALRPDGTVASTYIAEDPPWYGNTAHAPREQFIKDGKPFGRFVRPVCRLCDVKAGKITLDEYRARAGEFEVIEEEITPATKLRGMEDLPQPFLTPKPDRTVVLLDPMDDLTGRLIAMMQAGESVPELFAEGYLRVDNEALKRGSPPGVPVHPVRWR